MLTTKDVKTNLSCQRLDSQLLRPKNKASSCPNNSNRKQLKSTALLQKQIACSELPSGSNKLSNKDLPQPKPQPNPPPIKLLTCPPNHHLDFQSHQLSDGSEVGLRVYND